MKVVISLTAPVWVTALAYIYCLACDLLYNGVLCSLFGWERVSVALAAVAMTLPLLVASLVAGVTALLLDVI